jgi:hypothetical protein
MNSVHRRIFDREKFCDVYVRHLRQSCRVRGYGWLRGYGDTLLNPLSAAGLGPRFPGLGSRPVRVASRSRKAGDPRGRPIVSAPRSADIADRLLRASRSSRRILDDSSDRRSEAGHFRRDAKATRHPEGRVLNMQTWAFPAVIEKLGDDDFLATFPDVPEARTGGASLAEVRENAATRWRRRSWPILRMDDRSPTPASRSAARKRSSSTP